MMKSNKPTPRPRPKSMTATLRDAIFAPPADNEMPVAERIAQAVVAKALTGDIRAIEWVYDRIDGPIGISTSSTPTVNIIMPKKEDKDA